jgi:hypothetical protein
MKVLIVAKTHMKNAFCVGAYDITNKRNIRLLTSNELNQPTDTQFNVGQLWNMEYIDRANIIPPHVEDVLVKSASFLEQIQDISNFLLNNVPIWKGNPNIIFNEEITFPINRKSGFLERKNSSLSQSVGFWQSDKDLELTILEDKKHYLYFGEQAFSFSYVGVMDKVEAIPKNTLIRLSLARWWSPNPNLPKNCYCQISGWFMPNMKKN